MQASSATPVIRPTVTERGLELLHGRGTFPGSTLMARERDSYDLVEALVVANAEVDAKQRDLESAVAVRGELAVRLALSAPKDDEALGALADRLLEGLGASRV